MVIVDLGDMRRKRKRVTIVCEISGRGGRDSVSGDSIGVVIILMTRERRKRRVNDDDVIFGFYGFLRIDEKEEGERQWEVRQTERR